jgi:hypothetical protein
MSLKVAIVCEDHTNDQYIVQPAMKALFEYLGRPRARLQFVTNPRLQGLSSLLKNLCSIIYRYSAAADLVIVVVDNDCQDGRPGRENRRQRLLDAVANCPKGGDKTIVVVAIEEIEVWALWGQRNALGANWNVVRSECHPKERYFDGVLTNGDSRTPGGGRLRLMAVSLQNGWVSLKTGCSELQTLEDEVRAFL